VAEVIGRSLNPLDWLYLPWCQLSVHAFTQQIDESHDGVQWRTQLVRDVGEELAFHPVHAKQL
jgi:hypothetical protein